MHAWFGAKVRYEGSGPFVPWEARWLDSLTWHLPQKKNGIRDENAGQTGRLVSLGRLGGGILVHPAPGLATEASGLDIFDHQGRRAELISEGFVQIFKDTEARIQSYKINHFKWSHGMV